MTREEAFEAMKQGKKIRHIYFSSGEHLEMKDLYTIIDEEGYEFNRGWHIRKGGIWESGWSIVNEK